MNQIPTAQLWCRVSELNDAQSERDAARTQRDLAEAELARLRRRVAELENRPLIAVSPDVAALQEENTKLRNRLAAVRELLHKHNVLS